MGEITMRGPMMVGVLWMFQAIAFALVALRLYARLVVVQTYGWDDHCFNVAVLLLLLYTVLVTVSATFGVGRLQEDPEAQSDAFLFVNISQTVVSLASIFVKLSIAIFLYRLVSSNRRQKFAIAIPTIILIGFLLATVCVLWFSCTPISYNWDVTSRGEGSCNDMLQFEMLLAGGLSIPAVEVFYASFSWYLIRGLQIPKTEKVVIGTCMSIGYLSVICSVWRLIALLRMVNFTGDYATYLYNFPDLLIWHAGDIITQLICITVTVCRPLYKDWLNSVIGNVKTAVTSRISSKNSKEEASRVAKGFNFDIVALQTIGGSAVPSKTQMPGCNKEIDPGAVHVQKSWRVESNSRSTLFGLDDAESDEERILGGIVLAEVDRDVDRHS
ncbi:hypothetical protein N0V93_001698 [Gnomoniopsis smithogilvyi]|uniref:Rhodopsin domain-containing protein n=1 Tax=Gnomoniopsis smithogilvyi TaxID=1191159 RepID=A0A9W8Z602_9PEZI|nr:hypothetical protein N0V93_001698 [Gnomoniopsis smithogilvyi]